MEDKPGGGRKTSRWQKTHGKLHGVIVQNKKSKEPKWQAHERNESETQRQRGASGKVRHEDDPELSCICCQTYKKKKRKEETVVREDR